MDINLQNCISTNMKYLRNYYGYTQRQLAEILHISRSAYATVETGRRTPKLDLLVQLSDLFNIRIDIFFEENPQVFIQEVVLSNSKDEKISELISLYQTLSPFSQGCLFEKASRLWKDEQDSEKEKPKK